MSPAGPITFEQIEGRTQRVLAWAIFLKQWITSIRLDLVGLFVLPYVARNLRVLTAALSTETLDRMPEERSFESWRNGCAGCTRS